MQVDSPDAVKADGSSHVNIVRFSLGEGAKDKILAFFLALSVLVNVAAFFAIRDMGTEERLKQYNLDWFKTHEFSELKTEVAIQGRLLDRKCKE